LIIELRICLMVQFMKLWSIIFKSLSLPRDIRLVTPCRVIGIRVRVIPRSRELCVHMLIRIVRKLPCSRTNFNMVIRTKQYEHGPWGVGMPPHMNKINKKTKTKIESKKIKNKIK